MIEYKLLKFSGDKEVEGRATSIISWCNGDDDALMDVLNMKLTGIITKHVEFIGELNRWVINIVTASGDVIVTIDLNQKKIVFITNNENIRTMFRLVECMLNTGYDKDIVYKLQKIVACSKLTLRRRLLKR